MSKGRAVTFPAEGNHGALSCCFLVSHAAAFCKASTPQVLEFAGTILDNFVLRNSKHSAGDFGRSGPPVMILDELDSGVGARLGTPIANLLRQMASARHAGLTSQIICISHLPQVCSLRIAMKCLP